MTRVTPEEHAGIVARYRRGDRIIDIAAHYQLSTVTIHRHVSLEHVPYRRRVKRTPEERVAIVARYRNGDRVNYIARDFKISAKTVLKYVDMAGVSRRVNHITYQRIPQRTRRLLVVEYVKGVKVIAIAAEYSVHPRSIYYYVRKAGVPLRGSHR